jgi:DNA repair protein RadC
VALVQCASTPPPPWGASQGVASQPYVQPKRSTNGNYAKHPIIRQALKLLACKIQHTNTLQSPDAVKDYLKLKLGDRPHEVFAVVFMDSQNRVIACEEIFRGSFSQTSVNQREIVLEALKRTDASVILCHNHPSGNAVPSRADEALTQTLKNALALVDVRVLDHMIVTRAKVLSFAEEGLI